MPKIPLTKGQFALVDDADYADLLRIGNWCFSRNCYAVHYFADANGKRKTHFMHRVVMQHILGHAIPGQLQVDHINRDRLDNRRDNLRLATRSQNQAAKGLQINSASGQKGVTLRAGKWDVRLRWHGQRLHMGRYAEFEQAVKVYGFAHALLWQDFSTEREVAQQVSPAVQQLVKNMLAKNGILIDGLP